jgi:DNA repair protein RadA/Sms
VLVSIAGGIRVPEPAADLGLALAVASCALDVRVPGDMVAIGEVGLSGDLRSVGQVERRLAEAERLGFRRCVLPSRALKGLRSRSDLELLPCDSLSEVLKVVLGHAGGHFGDEAQGFKGRRSKRPWSATSRTFESDRETVLQ